MSRLHDTALSLALVALAALLIPVTGLASHGAQHEDARGDVTVVAVIDDAFNPYHLDFVASQMPQHRDADPSNDLPLDASPATWIPGYQRLLEPVALDLTLPVAATDSPTELAARDGSKWNDVQHATPYWIPGSKIVTAMTFSQTGRIRPEADPPSAAHGVGTSSVSVGNLYGSCPECVVVLLQIDTAAAAAGAVRWAAAQPWIDVITNSWGFSTASRDNVTWYSNPKATKDAVERGQTIFWSAGNGQENMFVTPVTTLHSSDKGPDWIVQVGAIHPSGSSFSGAGKPVEIAGVGSSYPSSINATTAANGASFGGTSNATPTLAGTYARALWLARRALEGPSKTQSDLVVATGTPVACGAIRPDCELGDGTLTSFELRDALFSASRHTPEGMNVGGLGNAPVIGDAEFANEGHGSWFVRSRPNRTDLWLAEFDRLWLPLIGDAAFPPRPAGEREWFVVESYCRQQIWGDWAHGLYRRGVTELPADDPQAPGRSALKHACETHPKLPPHRNLG